jgi:hypothetical protein
VILESSVAVLADDSAGSPPVDQGQVERIQTRVAPDGSRYSVYKRWLTAERLCSDLGGGDILHDGHYFVIVSSRSEPTNGGLSMSHSALLPRTSCAQLAITVSARASKPV